MDLRLDVPGLSGNLEKDIKNLSNYVFQLSEQLRYAMYNLDVTNFNDLGLARYENGRMQLYTEKLQVAANEMDIKLSDAKKGMEASIKAAAEGFSATVESYKETVDGYTEAVGEYKAAADGFSAKIEGVVDGEGEVTAASIVAAINGDGSEIVISADKVNLSGLVTVDSLENEDDTTVINGGEIRAATIYASGTMDGNNFYAYVVEDGSENEIGWVGYQWVKRETYGDDGIYGDKLWLKTEKYKVGGDKYYPCVKLSAAGNISMEAVGHEESCVYIAANNYITLNVNNGVSGASVIIYDDEGYEWKFQGGHLYRNKKEML